MKYFLAIIFIFSFGAACFAAEPSAMQHHVHSAKGKVLIDDGDTIVFPGRVIIRFMCIDAPESDQLPYGPQATAAMREMIGDKDVKCFGHFYDKYNRLLGFCKTDTDLLNLEMARRGLAIAAGGKQCHKVKAAEQEAKEAKRGIWSDANFIKPHEWRKLHPRAEEQQPTLNAINH